MTAKSTEFIPADKYKPLLPARLQKAAITMLRSSETLARGNQVIAARSADLRDAVLDLIGRMEDVAGTGNWEAAFRAAHEIRGLAGTAGLAATGGIANGLCQYLDVIQRRHAEPDGAVIGLHMSAIARSARTQEDTARHGDVVAAQLAALVNRKLAEIKK